MKLNINWKELGIQLLKAIWSVLAGALTGATVATATGCTSMTTQPRGQTPEIIACGIPPPPGYRIPRNWRKTTAATRMPPPTPSNRSYPSPP